MKLIKNYALGDVKVLNMERFFNTAGPVNEKWHYCVPPLTQLDIKNSFFSSIRYSVGFLHDSKPTKSVIISFNTFKIQKISKISSRVARCPMLMVYDLPSKTMKYQTLPMT